MHLDIVDWTSYGKNGLPRIEPWQDTDEAIKLTKKVYERTISFSAYKEKEDEYYRGDISEAQAEVLGSVGFYGSSCICPHCSMVLYKKEPRESLTIKAPRLFKADASIELFSLLLCPNCETIYAGVKRLDDWHGDSHHTLQLYLEGKSQGYESVPAILYDLRNI